MKIHTKAIATLVCLSTLHSFVKGNTFQRKSSTCSGPDPLEFSDSIGMQVEKVGSVPTQQTGAFTYNMMVRMIYTFLKNLIFLFSTVFHFVNFKYSSYLSSIIPGSGQL